MKAASVADNFDIIPDKTEIKALQSSIRSYLSQVKVTSQIFTVYCVCVHK